jgi:CRISPR system Cascade subunit CasE
MEVNMFLSKVFIPWQRSRNPYEVHRSLWHLFPKRPDDSRNFLFRIEKLQKDYGADILMQSMEAPIAGDADIRILAYREYDLSFENGQRLRFRLRGNPVKTIVDEKGRNSQKGGIKKCRVPLIREEEQRSWFMRKLDTTCRVESIIIQREVPLYFRKNKEQRTGKIQTLLFDGILCVQKPDAFLETLKKGIGPAKAFGCGLLSIALA